MYPIVISEVEFSQMSVLLQSKAISYVVT